MKIIQTSILKRLYSCTPTSLPTIYALATPTGTRSAIAILRVSGSQTKYIYEQLTNKSISKLKPRHAHVSPIFSINKQYHGSKENCIDSPLMLYFAKPNSFTGEDMIEFHLHGGKAIINEVIKSISNLQNPEKSVSIRYAEPGEFSRRAFINGKFDLTEVESINDLINAETEMQRKSVMSSFNGQNQQLFNEWRQELVGVMAKLTAVIDFTDDNDMENIDATLLNEIEREVIELRKNVTNFINQLNKSTLLLDGIKLVLFGSPNVGKSSILNCITDEEVAIVSDIPGTTRDSINSVIDMNGYKVIMVDTAGIRSKSHDSIELIGIERAKKKVHDGDICVLIVDATCPTINESLLELIQNETRSEMKQLIIVINKIDLISKEILNKIQYELNQRLKSLDFKTPNIITISCKTKDGLSELFTLLTEKCKEITNIQEGVEPIIMSQRVKDILINDIIYGIDEFLRNRKEVGNDLVILSETLQYSIDGISKILGDAIGLDEVLDVVFSKFCVGK